MEKSCVDDDRLRSICPYARSSIVVLRYLDQRMLRPRSSAVRSLPNGGIGKERLNRRFLISPYGFHPAPWAGSAPRRVRRRDRTSPHPPSAPSTFFEPSILYVPRCRGASLYSRHSKAPLLLPCRGPEL